jgi:hypothetical protein
LKTLQTASGGSVSGVPANTLSHFLTQTHAALSRDQSGAVADYIPELLKADPDHFGIALATADGHVYETGDANVAFTIQSISKAFVFALALEIFGPGAGNRRGAQWRCLQLHSLERRQPAVQSHGEFRRHRLLRTDP